MSILLSETEKGKPVLIENGFDYIQERAHENKIHWRCTQCNKQKCKARLYTTNNTICYRVGDHNHAPNPSLNGIRQCRSEIRDLCKTTITTHSIVATSIATTSTAVLSQLPPINNLKRTICRRRAANLNFPANPRSISEIHINGSFALTKKKEQFLQPLFNPSSFLIDFESGAMKAINSRWPQSSVHACFFHLTQNIYRQVQKAGFTTKYGNDEEYAHAVRMLPALAFLETNDIYSVFEDIGNLQISDLDPIYNYFEDYYI
ncbi:unnamed protein product, partial [Rotaria sordida]